jgi:hypothetical protein
MMESHMATEKQERHGHGHDHHNERERPASTDLADVISDDHAAHAASAHQRKHAGKAPAVDERFGEGSKSDVEGRIIKVDVVGGRTQLTIGLGQAQGVRAGMEGYVKAGGGSLTDFQIESATDRVSIATVDVSPHAIQESPYVVVNPSAKPAAGKDIKGRVIANAIEGDRVRLTIGLGASNGVRVGMSGFMHSGDGKSYKDLVVSEVTSRTCVAFVQLHNLDEVHAHLEIVLNASASAGEDKGHPKPGKKHD